MAEKMAKPVVHIPYLMYMPSHPLKPIVDWIFRILYFLSRIQKEIKYIS